MMADNDVSSRSAFANGYVSGCIETMTMVVETLRDSSNLPHAVLRASMILKRMRNDPDELRRRIYVMIDGGASSVDDPRDAEIAQLRAALARVTAERDEAIAIYSVSDHQRDEACRDRDRAMAERDTARADLAKLSRVLADERAAVAIAHKRIAEVTAELDESLPMSIGTAVLRALEPMDESEELTRADRIDYIATSHGEDSWSHDVLRAVAAALRAHAAGSVAAEASEPSPPPTAPPLLEWGPDGPRLSEYERKRLERDEASGGVCEVCADGCYPYYGGAPGRDYAGPTDRDITYTTDSGDVCTLPAGTFVFAQRQPSPRDTWPSNFREDPECPGLGTWSCPVCNGTGRAGGPNA